MNKSNAMTIVSKYIVVAKVKHEKNQSKFTSVGDKVGSNDGDMVGLNVLAQQQIANC